MDMCEVKWHAAALSNLDLIKNRASLTLLLESSVFIHAGIS